MRSALWLLGLFAVATAAALFAGENSGLVSVFVTPHRLDVSLNLAVLALIAFSLVVHLALLSLRTLFRLPQAARQWRSHQRERAAVAAMASGTANFLAGRFTRAVRDAEHAHLHAQAFQHDPFDDGLAQETPHPVLALSNWLAAEAHHALQNTAQRDQLLMLAQNNAKGSSIATTLQEGLQLRAARFALDDRDPKGASSRLQGLPAGVRRRTAALRLQLRAARMGNQPLAAVEVARALAKHGAFSQVAALALRRSLAIDAIRQTKDSAQLLQVWKTLDAHERDMPEVATAAAEHLRGQQWPDVDHAHQTAKAWLDPIFGKWAQLNVSQQLQLARHLPWALQSSTSDGAWLSRIEALHQQHPNDAAAAFLAAQVFLDRQLWGKAQLGFAKAAKALPDKDLTRQAFLALAALAEQRGDREAAQQALQKAAAS